MSIFDMITPEEQEMACQYINAYGNAFENGGKQMVAPLKHILRFWEKNKQDLFRVLGNQLIVSKNISFQRPEELIEDDICNMLNDSGWDFRCNYRDLVIRVFGKSYWDRNLPELLFSDRSLFTNIYDGKTFSFPTPGGREIIVEHGCKVIKTLGKIAKAYNLEGFESFRIGHSMCLNQKAMHGKLCLSIHPLDYMTMSDNECNWESCMSWREWGSYRQGTVEMMNSAYIVVVYLASDTDMSLGSGKWNNKKWRQLFMVTPEAIMGIRQYPYYSEECEGIALNWLRELAQKNAGWGPYCKNVAKISNSTNNLFAEINTASWIALRMNHMYNDITNNQRGYVSVNFPTSFKLNLSGESECMFCGCEFEGDEDSESLICYECSGAHRCARCGCMLHYEEDEFYFDEECYCEECFYEIATVCDFCNDTMPSEVVHSVYMKHNDTITGYYLSVCEDCLTSNSFIEAFGFAHLDDSRYPNWVVETKNFSEEGWEAFLPNREVRESFQKDLY